MNTMNTTTKNTVKETVNNWLATEYLGMDINDINFSYFNANPETYQVNVEFGDTEEYFVTTSKNFAKAMKADTKFYKHIGTVDVIDYLGEAAKAEVFRPADQ